MSSPADHEACDPMHALYVDHHSWLYHWIVKRMECHFDASELVQDTFLRVHERRDAATIDAPRPYLSTIAKGLISHFYRRKALESAYLETLSHLPEPMHPSEEHRYILLQTLMELDSYLDKLPVKVRDVFLMAQLEGKKYQAIADETGYSLITVKRYIKQAYVHCLTVMDSEL